MDLDRLLQIFGSFTRKKKKGTHETRKSLQPTSLSAGNSPIHQEFRRNSQPLNGHIPPRTSAYGERPRKLKEWDCGLCRRELVEPRLLGCLHSFCTRCLLNYQEGEWSEVDCGSSQYSRERSHSSGATSAGSGYESELRDLSGSEVSWSNGEKSKCRMYTRKVSGKTIQYLICPTCKQETQLPAGGITDLPLNYVILRKMMAAGLDDSDYDSVLCDMCTTDNRAESRCSHCLVSVCSSCSTVHGHQKTNSKHSLYPLGLPPPLKYCTQHPRAELGVYCATCQQVICRECCLGTHSGHALANATRAAAERARQLRDACDRARHVPQQAETAARFLNVQAMEVDVQASRVESQISTWADQYRRAVDFHSRSLCAAAAKARQKYQDKFAEKNYELESRAKQAKEAVKFAEEILSEAKDDELLSLSGPVLRRLERLCDSSSTSAIPKFELKFAPTAPVNDILVGRLMTRAPDPDKCVINVEALQDLEVDVKHSFQLELRDSEGATIEGGAAVAGYFRRHDSSATPEFAKVSHVDGAYTLTICPRSPGAYLFAVTVNNKPIKGSPFPCSVRNPRGHSGKYHCCSFCSTNGNKEAVCACPGTMNGYKGCGHGHAGHPGSKHWSCCGSTQIKGPCTPAPSRTSQTYHFSL